MNPFKNLFRSKKVKNQTNFIGRTSIGLSNPGKYMGLDLHSDTYASAYPSIRAISNEYMTVLPKAIDGNGKPVKSNILDALYHPNQKDSVVSFNEKLATSTLVLPQTYILVWRNERGEAKPGGDFGFKGGNIAGFTFLENPGISQRDGKIYYNIGSQWFTEDEVLVLPGGVDPHNLYGGYSPTEAACRWITLDDYIADFQKGFFENNAIPAGMFKISAATPTEFEDIVSNLKRRHKGAGSNNNVTYSHAPVDPATGKVAEAKIEWIPFQQSNKDIDFEALFKQANHRIDQAYGVPAIVKGIDDAATYANAQVAEAGFAKRAVLPLLTRNYAQLTHELNRITGGMGIALTFDYEIPAVADEEKVVAETHVIHANLLNSLELNGYSLDSIVDAFDLPKRIKLLEKGDQAAVIDNDKPEVDEGNEVTKSPDPDKIDGVTPVARGSERKNPKAELTDEEKLKEAARQFMRSQIEREVDLLSGEVVAQEPTDDELDAFVVAMMAVISTILLVYGEEGYAMAAGIAGLAVDELRGFTLADDATDAYRGYLRGVGQSYGNDTAESIRKVLQDARDRGLNIRETEDALRNILNTDEWRVERLARTELNNSQNIGKLEGAKELRNQVGGVWEKTINHVGMTNICPLCASQEGIWTPIDDALFEYGDSISTLDDDGNQVIYVNNWQTNEANDYHPNGRGSLIFRRTEENGI